MTCLALYTICCLICSLQFVSIGEAVRGCVTFVAGDDYSMRQSICDKLDTHFTVIPKSLPSQVVKLTVNHQDITHLNASQFEHLPNLTYLNLDSNKIVFIHPHTFDNLIYLHTLSLRYNELTISDNSFHPNVVHGLSNLISLNLLQNPLGTIPSHFFEPMGKHLRSLVLAGSSDSFHLNTDSLSGLYKLQHLDLSYNHLDTLPESMEHILNQMQLQEFYLYGNPWRCDCHLRWLKVWFLKHNSKLIHSKPISERHLKSPLNTATQNWYTSDKDGARETSTILQPLCAYPSTLYGRPLFNHRSNAGIQTVRTTDFHCLPESHTPNQELYFNRGTNITLSCDFFADPSGIVVWYKDGTRIQNHWPRMESRQEQGRRFQAQLNIYDSQVTDSGTYSCYLDTGYGRVNSTLTIKIETNSIGFNTPNLQGVFQWISKLDTTLVLKYTGIIASCLIILLMLMGLLIYCFYGRHSCCIRGNVPKNPLNSRIKYDSQGHIMNESNDYSTRLLSDESCSPENKRSDSSNSRLSNCMHSKNSKTEHSLNLLPCSSALKKDAAFAISSCQNIITPTVNTTYDSINGMNSISESNRGFQLLHKPTTIDNYVTFRILPAVTRPEIATHCPLHNYAVIQPIHTEGIQNLTSVSEIPTVNTTNIVGINSINETSNSIENSYEFGNQVRPEGEYALPRDPADIIQLGSSENNLNSEMESSIYLPCPLHGNLFATLQTKERNKANSEIRKHIAHVPSGLEFTHDKRHTLPNRKAKYRNPISESHLIPVTEGSIVISSTSSEPTTREYSENGPKEVTNANA